MSRDNCHTVHLWNYLLNKWLTIVKKSSELWKNVYCLLLINDTQSLKEEQTFVELSFSPFFRSFSATFGYPIVSSVSRQPNTERNTGKMSYLVLSTSLWLIEIHQELLGVHQRRKKLIITSCVCQTWMPPQWSFSQKQWPRYLTLTLPEGIYIWNMKALSLTIQNYGQCKSFCKKTNW